jgi:hypothetical protein
MSTSSTGNTSKAVKPRKLTKKQREFVKEVSKGTPAYKAAQKAYDTKDLSVANAIAVENLQKPSIAQALEAAYEKLGISVEAIVRPVADGLQATKSDMSQGTIPDHTTRLKAAGMAAQWIGVGRETQVNGGIHFHQHTGEKKEDYGF